MRHNGFGGHVPITWPLGILGNNVGAAQGWHERPNIHPSDAIVLNSSYACDNCFAVPTLCSSWVFHPEFRLRGPF
jgi:hypothetical protein